MKPVMNKKPIVLGVLLGLLVWALLIGGVAAVLAQDDAEPFATVTPDATAEVTPESTEEVVIVVPDDPALVEEIGDAVRDEVSQQLPGLFNSVLVLVAFVIVSVVLPALVLLYRSAPPWLQKPLAELLRSGADGVSDQYARVKTETRKTQTPLDDIIVDALEQPIETLLNKIRLLDAQVQAKLDNIQGQQATAHGAPSVTRPLDNDPLALG